MYIYLLFSLISQKFHADILKYTNVIKNKLPEDFFPEPEIVVKNNQILLFWTRETLEVRKKINPGILYNSKNDCLLCSGYAAPGILNADSRENIFSLISYSSGNIRLKNSPGGIGSYVFISNSKNESFIWSTQPPGYSTFIAKNNPYFCVAGNRPSLVHCASLLSEGAIKDRSYFYKYVSAGFAVDSTTLYKNTFAVPPYKALNMKDGTYSYIDYPLAAPEKIPANEPLKNKCIMLAALLMDACWPARHFNNSYLALSGGKDSRTIAAVLSALGVHTTPYTYGHSTHEETLVASEVARAARFQEIQINSHLRNTCPLRAAIASNKETDGLGIAHAHQFDLRYQYKDKQKAPIFHGNGHLLRGGNAVNMSTNDAYLNKLLFHMFSGFVKKDVWLKEREILLNWKNWRSQFFKDKREVLFYLHQDFRIGLFSAPLNLYTSATAFFVYPLMDERVARFASALNIFDRVSERVVFGAIRFLCNPLSNIGLYNEIWRFDQYPERTCFVDSNHNYQEGFIKRQPRTLKQRVHSEYHKDYLGGSSNRNQTMAQFILDSSYANELRKILIDDVYFEIMHRATGNTAHSAFYAHLHGVAQRAFESFFCRLFIACSLYDSQW